MSAIAETENTENTLHSITPELLRQIVPSMPLSKRRLWAPFINAAAIEFDITNEARVAAWLAQMAEETDHFNTLREYASGAEYDHRVDLGNTRSEAIRIAAQHGTTPGRFYKGRGGIQTTGYVNYLALSNALGEDFTAHPELLEQPEYAFRAAGYFWKTHHLNELADERRFKEITRKVNGGYNGLAVRTQFYRAALKAIPDNFKLTINAPAPNHDAVPDLNIHQPDQEEFEAQFETQAEETREIVDEGNITALPQNQDVNTDQQNNATTQAPTTKNTAQPGSDVNTSVSLDQSAPVNTQANTQSKIETGTEYAEKVTTSWKGMATSWWPMISAPVLGLWASFQSLPPTTKAILIGGMVLGGLAIGALVWDRTQQRRMQTQHKLIDTAAATDKNTVSLQPAPVKAS